MLSTLLAQADPQTILPAPDTTTWPQLWLTLLLSLPTLLTAVVAAVTSLRNAARIKDVHRDINGRMDQLLANARGLARAEGAASHQNTTTPERLDRIEQVLGAFEKYVHTCNHEVRDGLHSIRQAIEVVREEAKRPPGTAAGDATPNG